VTRRHHGGRIHITRQTPTVRHGVRILLQCAIIAICTAASTPPTGKNAEVGYHQKADYPTVCKQQEGEHCQCSRMRPTRQCAHATLWHALQKMWWCRAARTPCNETSRFVWTVWWWWWWWWAARSAACLKTPCLHATPPPAPPPHAARTSLHLGIH
jgi:hypothetical protein